MTDEPQPCQRCGRELRPVTRRVTRERDITMTADVEDTITELECPLGHRQERGII